MNSITKNQSYNGNLSTELPEDSHTFPGITTAASCLCVLTGCISARVAKGEGAYVEAYRMRAIYNTDLVVHSV